MMVGLYRQKEERFYPAIIKMGKKGAKSGFI
jgi:hypothetical protein